MKIESLNDLSAVVHGADRRAQESNLEVATFERFLNQEMAEVRSGPAIQVPEASAGGGQGLPGTPVAEAAGGVPPLFGALTGVLDRLMDMCSQSVGPPPKLEAVAQVLTDLGHAADEVLRHTQSLAEDHPARRIAAEARVLAYVESIKWRRGDYLELG